MEKHVYLVRHGESEANAGKIHLGKSAQLTEKGHSQARVVAERIGLLNIEALITSNFPRAVDTSAYISKKLGIQVEEQELFGEWTDPTHLMGVSHTDPQFLETYQKINEMSHDPHFRLHDEETFAEIAERGRKALDLLATHTKDRICVVTHGGFLRILVGIILFQDTFTRREFISFLENFRTINTGITYIRYTEEGWKLMTLNDYAHLG